uniref:Protein RIC-3 n=1 Tax=Geotrypetes seraphini TaxID=260995 RepID=A0A6P8QCY8_GEOSA|nr:protein RIC-3 [Geotrypetes seraphini]
MALSTFQKVATVSGLVLCISLLLPRAFVSRGKPIRQQEGTSGRFPSALHQKMAEGRSAGSPYPRPPLAEAMSKAKMSSGGARHSLVGQIIPIYGFGIFLYILYILFKLSSKGKTNKAERKSYSSSTENLKRKITDYELSQLQDKLRETEEAMEKIISRIGANCERAEPVSADQEQKLLEQLKEITRVMKEGKLFGGVSPEKEAEEAPYMQDQEGYPEETCPLYENADCCRGRFDTVLVDCSEIDQPSAEELAERMEVEEDEDNSYSEMLAGNPSKIHDSFRDEEDAKWATCSDWSQDLRWSQTVDKYPSYDHEDSDPAIQAENSGFGSDSCSDQDGHFDDGFCWDSEDEIEGEANNKAIQSHELGALRKRGRKGSELFFLLLLLGSIFSIV